MFKKLCSLRATVVQGAVYFLMCEVIYKASASTAWQRMQRRVSSCITQRSVQVNCWRSALKVCCILHIISKHCILTSFTCIYCRCKFFIVDTSILLHTSLHTIMCLQSLCIFTYASSFCLFSVQCVRRSALGEKYYYIMTHNSILLLLLLLPMYRYC